MLASPEAREVLSPNCGLLHCEINLPDVVVVMPYYSTPHPPTFAADRCRLIYLAQIRAAMQLLLPLGNQGAEPSEVMYGGSGFPV